MKRITRGEFREVADETLTELLAIATMVVKMYAIRREGEHDVLHLWCAHRVSPPVEWRPMYGDWEWTQV